MTLTMKPILAPLLAKSGEVLEFSMPLGALPVMAAAAVLLAGFVAAGMMIFASFARTFKEGQSMITPFYMLIMLPVMFLQVPGLEFSFLLAAIPVVNVTMMVREAIAGIFHWPQIGLTIAVSAAVIAALLRLATFILRFEDVMIGSYGGTSRHFRQGTRAQEREEAGPCRGEDSMMGAPVSVSGLTKIFYDESRGEVRAVDGIDFECRAGEIFGLLGANGAGKTTTLRMLATILAPTGGQRDADGPRRGGGAGGGAAQASASTRPRPRSIRVSRPARRSTSSRASTGFLPAQVTERVTALVARFGIGEYADARVDKLSQGMKQKVSIARTVAHDPPVLIFDEPTVGLDVLNAIDMQKVIAEFRAEGKAIIFSTHIMSEAEKLCDRIAIIHRGRIHACDTLARLREATGQRYLEDIFVHYVERANA